MKNIYLTLWASLLLCLSQMASAQVPKLNSFPSAKATIFLDFDGHIVQGTSWNSSGPIVCEGSNLNAAQITEIFNRVAEDYRPFNINITTDSVVYQNAPATQRTRVVLTISSDWYGRAGGVSFTNSFTWGDNTPCFVFTALLNYNVKNIAEAASHEVGHTLGLNHQSSYDAVCNKTAEYNAGNGSGEIGWAPIMGVGYYRNQTLWHYGTNPWGCNYLQDDLGIITSSVNGFGYRTDDHGNTTASATVANFTDSRFTVNGIVEKPTDVDVVKFTLASKSRFQLNALPFSVASGDAGANVDLQVDLVNGNGAAASYNPPLMLSASIDTLLDAGTYYLQVKSSGNAFAPDYASLGSYTLSAAIAASTLPVHKLELKATTENNRHKLDWEIVADETVVSQKLEVATDGVNYRQVADVAAGVRTFSYVPEKASLLYYRLNVVFDNGRQYYSNVTALRSNGNNNKPSLIGNTVTNTLSVNSPAGFAYIIVDLSGRTVAKGQLTEGVNTITTGFLTNGMYILQFSNQQEQYTEKFMKR
jgi:hypothetical protein